MLTPMVAGVGMVHGGRDCGDQVIHIGWHKGLKACPRDHNQTHLKRSCCVRKPLESRLVLHEVGHQ